MCCEDRKPSSGKKCLGTCLNSSFRKGKEAVLVPMVLRKVLEIKQKVILSLCYCFCLLLSLAQLVFLFQLSLCLVSPLLCWFLPSLPLPSPASSLLPPEELKKPDLSLSGQPTVIELWACLANGPVSGASRGEKAGQGDAEGAGELVG